MSTVKPLDPRTHAGGGTKRLRRVVPVIASAVVSASLIAATAGTASAAGRPAPNSLAVTVTSASTTSLATAARYIQVRDGRFVLDAVDAQKAGVDSRTVNADRALVAGLNRFRDRATSIAGRVHAVRVTSASLAQIAAGQAAAQDITVTLWPGITLTVNNVGITLSLTPAAVHQVDAGLIAAADVAELVGAILEAVDVELGDAIAEIVAAAIDFFTDGFDACTASDGSATFIIRWTGLPSCSGLSPGVAAR